MKSKSLKINKNIRKRRTKRERSKRFKIKVQCQGRYEKRNNIYKEDNTLKTKEHIIGKLRYQRRLYKKKITIE